MLCKETAFKSNRTIYCKGGFCPGSAVSNRCFRCTLRRSKACMMYRLSTSVSSVDAITSTTRIGLPKRSRIWAGKQCKLGICDGGTKGHKLLKRQIRFLRIDSRANDLVNLLRCPRRCVKEHGYEENWVTNLWYSENGGWTCNVWILPSTILAQEADYVQVSCNHSFAHSVASGLSSSSSLTEGRMS